MSDLLLDVCHVSKIFSRGGLLSRQRITAVDDVSFQIDKRRPEILAVIGESGSGKTTLCRMILNLELPTTGRLVFDGVDLATIRTAADRMMLRQGVQPIFQNPFDSFNPMKRLERYLFLTQRRFLAATQQPASSKAAIDDALHQVGLSLKEVSHRYPHELSGGQLQRVAIARALLARPKLIVADEPVSMVDASLRLSIVNLFRTVRDLGISIIYVTHDLATAYYISDRILVIRNGSIVESGDAKAVLKYPQHPYCRQLRDAVLLPDLANAAADVPISMTGVKGTGEPDRRP
ncbi:putative ATP-binding component of ABC transporter [Bradyrhizobium sp. STM 3843]|uniref:ABC transporter ATP-binding protein n=1 Tax=Bradyrhizobium sp. STM 3843 TaxID=551947 RepID=UPI0002406C3D|nr:ATP-binding cassette domain-containing protein [Bradyrhizobium sp. STM 3843]CCE06223.1 putative ATP-binding component of ABC transporter [Bradyrhizobium sp. STM 3843]